MKKALLALILVASIAMVGCGKESTEDLEKKMKEYATTYYERYGTLVTGVSMDYEVTLGALRDMNESENVDEKDRFDLSMFEDCKDSTKAMIKATSDQKIDSVKVKLNCK